MRLKESQNRQRVFGIKKDGKDETVRINALTIIEIPDEQITPEIKREIRERRLLVVKDTLSRKTEAGGKL